MAVEEARPAGEKVGGDSGETSVAREASMAEEKAGGDAGGTSVNLEVSIEEEKAGEKATVNAGGASTPPSFGAEAPPPADRGAGPAAAASSGGRSFSQLLAGAMASPAGSPRPPPIVTVNVVAVGVPCFLAPAALIESPGFTGQFSMTHQAVLATVTAQAQMQLQTAASSNSTTNSFQQPMLSTVKPTPLQQMPPPTPKKTSGDVYNWRKYGQKQVKSSENARSYYRCTDSNCSAKKKVEHSPDGTVVEVVYKGKHNHDPPHKHRYTRERGAQYGGPSLQNENKSLEHLGTETNESDPSACKTEQKSGNGTPKQQSYCSSEGVFNASTKSEEDIADEPDPKRRLSENSKSSSAPILKTIKEYIVQTEIDARHLSDGYRWRKYGQKIVKGNRNPRSYYRCTHNGCPVRKHVERVPDDAKALLITYEGEHNHDQPNSKYASEPPSTATKSNAAAAGTTDDEFTTSNSSSVKKSSEESRRNSAAEEVTGDKELDLGGDRALESAQALLSIGFSSSSGEGTGRNNSEGMKNPVFNENPAAVSVQNS